MKTDAEFDAWMADMEARSQERMARLDAMKKADQAKRKAVRDKLLPHAEAFALRTLTRSYDGWAAHSQERDPYGGTCWWHPLSMATEFESWVENRNLDSMDPGQDVEEVLTTAEMVTMMTGRSNQWTVVVRRALERLTRAGKACKVWGPVQYADARLCQD